MHHIEKYNALNISKINTILVIPLTTNLLLEDAPGNVLIEKADSKLSKDSVIVVSQLSAIDKSRLINYESKISNTIIEEIENGIKLVIGIK